jgi:chorismate synthase
MKPISTVLNPRRSVNLATGKRPKPSTNAPTFAPCPAPPWWARRWWPLPWPNALMQKLGGDSLEEMEPRFTALRQARLSDLPMDDVPWQFGYV